MCCKNLSENLSNIMYVCLVKLNLKNHIVHKNLLTIVNTNNKPTTSTTEGYNNLRQKFGPDSFWVNGPYHAIMAAINGPGEGSYFSFNRFNTNPESCPMANMLPPPQSLIQQSSNLQQLLQTAQQQLQDSSSFMHSQPALAVLPGQLFSN